MVQKKGDLIYLPWTEGAIRSPKSRFVSISVGRIKSDPGAIERLIDGSTTHIRLTGRVLIEDVLRIIDLAENLAILRVTHVVFDRLANSSTLRERLEEREIRLVQSPPRDRGEGGRE